MKKKAAAAIIIARRSRGFNTSRLDAKTKGVKACTIGNKRCGGRCIPREWNCRLKGEGDDSHQRAAGKGRDPLAAVASIERGIKRVRRGFTTGSFSEIEGGRRAIIRGVIKGSSKDLQQKKELQAKLINTTIGVGAVAGVAAAGFFGHARLMNSPLYARTIGRRLEDSIVDGFNRTMDAVNPFRRARTATAQAAVGRASRVAAGVAVTTDPDAVLSSNRILRVAANPPETGTWARNAITNNVNSIRPDAYSTKEAWHIASVRAMWETPRTDEQFRLMGRSATQRGFYFSTVGAENFLRRQYRINDIEVAGSGLITRMSNELAQQNQAIVAYARDRRIDLSNDRQRRNLAATLVQGSGVARTPEMRRAAQRALYELADPKFSARRYAQDQYRQVNRNFDTILKGALTEVNASIYNRQGRRVSRTPLITAIAEGHADYLAQRMYPNARGARIVTGPATTDLVIDNYYRVLRGTTSAARARETPWTAPRGRVIAAAREMTGRTYTDPEQALRDLQSRGAFPGLRLEPTSAQARAAQNATRGRLVTEADLIERYLSSGRYKSREAAERAARAYIEKRNARAARNSRTDSSATARADAAKGKPCGASHIPANKKCSKPVVNSPKSSASAESTKSSSAGALKVAGAGAVVVAGAATLGFKKRRSIGAYTKFTPKVMNAAIVRMSQKDVQNGIKKVPERFRGKVSNLVGKAKVAAAVMSADAQGYNIVKVDNKRNYTTWRNDKLGKTTSIASVGDSLVMFNTTRTGRVDLQTANGRGVDVIDMDFQVDLGFQQKNVSRQEGMDTVKAIKSMYETSKTQLPRNALLRNVPYGKDSKGARRSSLYKRAGFKNLKGLRGEAQYALFNDGKVEAIPDQYEDLFADLIQGSSYDDAVKKWQTARA